MGPFSGSAQKPSSTLTVSTRPWREWRCQGTALRYQPLAGLVWTVGPSPWAGASCTEGVVARKSASAIPIMASAAGSFTADDRSATGRERCQRFVAELDGSMSSRQHLSTYPARHRAHRRRAGPRGCSVFEGGVESSIRAAVKRVVERLGNTPAVCRGSYIDPRVLDRRPVRRSSCPTWRPKRPSLRAGRS